MRWRQSARFTPPAAMRISTSPGFGSGTGRVAGTSTSGPPGLLISITVWVAGMLASTGRSSCAWSRVRMANPLRSRQDGTGGTVRCCWEGAVAAIVPMVDLWPGAAAFPAEGYRLLYPGSLSLFGFIGFTVLKIPGGWSNPLYLAPLFVSVVLTYGMFWFVWAYFGALVAFASLAAPYVLAEITGSILPIRIRAILVFVAFAGSIVCADMAVHRGELG